MHFVNKFNVSLNKKFGDMKYVCNSEANKEKNAQYLLSSDILAGKYLAAKN